MHRNFVNLKRVLNSLCAYSPADPLEVNRGHWQIGQLDNGNTISHSLSYWLLSSNYRLLLVDLDLAYTLVAIWFDAIKHFMCNSPII